MGTFVKKIILVVLLLMCTFHVPIDHLFAKETHFISAGDWSDEFNWDNGVPEENDDVYIDANCTVDFFADIPATLNTLIISATLDDSGEKEDFSTSGNVEIKNGGNFLCGGDLDVGEQLWIYPGGSGTFDGTVSTIADLVVYAGATFKGTVNVGTNLDIGGDNSGEGTYTVTFNENVTCTSGNVSIGSTYGTATAVFKKDLNCGNYNVTVDDGDTLTFRGTMTANRFTINSGTVNAYANLHCSEFTMGASGAFISNADAIYTVTVKMEPNGNFQINKGTFRMEPSTSWGVTIRPMAGCYFHNLEIAGNGTTDIEQADPNNPNALDVNGNLSIYSGATFQVNEWQINLAGDFTCNGSYYYPSNKTPNFVFDGSRAQSLTGNVQFYDLTVNSGSTVNTSSYTPSVAPASLTENGYLQGNIKCTQEISSDATYSLGNLGCQLTNGSGLGTVTVTRHTGSAHSGASRSLTRWYNISASAADNNVTLRLEYRDSELNGNNEANLNIWRYSSGNWTKYAATSRDASSNYVEAVVEVPSGSSDWVLSDAEDDQSLPVEFISASATFDAEHNAVQLRWKVASEVDNLGFTIDRRILPDGQYGAIGFVGGRGSEPTAMSYSYADKLISPDTWYAYRISSKHLDGTLTVLTDELKVFTRKGAIFPKDLTLYQNQPNPFRGATTLRFWLPAEENTTLRIYDLHGRLVYQHSFGKLKRGMHQVVWQGRDDARHDFCAGLYFYELQAGEHRLTGKMIRIR